MLEHMKKLFTEHPSNVNETYLEHMCYAFKCGVILTFTGLACLIHSVFPFLFVTTASETVVKMYKHIKERNPKYRTKK